MYQILTKNWSQIVEFWIKEERNVVSAIIEEREESKVDAVVVEQVKLVRQIFCCRGTGETDIFVEYSMIVDQIYHSVEQK